MANEGIGGSVDDQALQTKLACVTVPYSAMSLTLVEGAPNLLGGLGANLPNVVESGGVATAEQAGIKMDDGDEVYGRLDLRGDAWWRDPQRDILAEVVYEVEEASKANMDWALWVKGLAAGEAISDAKVSADASLTFPAVSNTNAGEMGKTARLGLGLVQGATNELVDDDYALFAVELDDKGTASVDKIFLIAVRFWFTVQFAHSSGVRQLT